MSKYDDFIKTASENLSDILAKHLDNSIQFSDYLNGFFLNKEEESKKQREKRLKKLDRILN